MDGVAGFKKAWRTQLRNVIELSSIGICCKSKFSKVCMGHACASVCVKCSKNDISKTSNRQEGGEKQLCNSVDCLAVDNYVLVIHWIV